MSWASLAGTGIAVSSSPAESARFGCSISRLVVGRDAPDGPGLHAELREALSSSTVDLLICRWPAERIETAAIALASDRVLLPADTLTYWGVGLDAFGSTEAPLTADLRTEVLQQQDAGVAALIAEVIEDSFRGYGNHYAANPRLDDEAALQGYVEWALRAYAAPGNAVLLRHEGEAVGVATLEHSGDDLEIELAGLIGAQQGKGWYGHLLRAVGVHAAQLGCRRMIISTQMHNVRVQRAWARLGLLPFGTVSTVHAMTREFWGG